MKKYAMVPICSKGGGDEVPSIRRVLIEFKDTVSDYTIVDFKGTRFIDCDPYFYCSSSSHQYAFDDDGYKLISARGEVNWYYPDNMYNKRNYHYIISTSCLKPPAIMFEAESDEEAKTKFHNRTEKRD